MLETSHIHQRRRYNLHHENTTLKHMSNSPYQLTANILRYLLVGLFLWAGITKLLDPKNFARSIDAFGLVPEDLLVVTAIGLPIAEILIAIAVAFHWRFSLPLMAGLLLVFIGVLWHGVLQDLNVDCGCFSLSEKGAHTSLKTAFWRDWLMLTAVAYIFAVDRLFKSRPTKTTLVTNI